MKVKYEEHFKEDYIRVIQNVSGAAKFNRELQSVVNMLQNGSALPDRYVVNRIAKSGKGWYECYVYHDERDCIVMYYRIYEQCVYLCRIGTPSMLMDLDKGE